MSASKISKCDYQKTINAMKEADTYENCRTVLNGGVFFDSPYIVNNSEILPFLKQKPNRRLFQELFALADSKGVFDLEFCHGIPCVTLAAGARHMTRKWPRDNAGMAELIKHKYPDKYENCLIKTAEAYLSRTEMQAFGRVLNCPADFKKNLGIAHVFWQRSNTGKLYRDKKWFVHQRIESHAELLRLCAELLKEYAGQSVPLPQTLYKSVIYLTHYLYCLGISPQTCGPWEEIPFPKGSNWDCACIIAAFESVQKMATALSDANYNLVVREEDRLCRKFRRTPLIRRPDKLRSYCQKSLAVIRRHYLDEFRGCTNRVDAASVMLAAADLPLDDIPAEDVKKRLELLKLFEKNLLGRFGARRYSQFRLKIDSGQIDSCDSYLQLNYNILVDNRDFLIKADKKDWIRRQENEDNDASTARGFNERRQACDEKSSAQWGLPLSYAAIAYCKMVLKLQSVCPSSVERDKLLAVCRQGAEYFIKRCYAAISGRNADGTIPFKANGEPSLPWKKPEAYQAVSKFGSPQEWAFIPGVNSHLGWDAAKCWEASRLYLQTLA